MAAVGGCRTGLSGRRRGLDVAWGLYWTSTAARRSNVVQRAFSRTAQVASSRTPDNYINRGDPFAPHDTFAPRHLGPRSTDIPHMLATIKSQLTSKAYESLDEFVNDAVPGSVRTTFAQTGRKELTDEDIPPLSEGELARRLTELGALNNRVDGQGKLLKSMIGLGYHNVILPNVIRRNLLENPGWYTSYTAYQAEISQGRLESLLNFQTMTVNLTGLPLANASLLDEGTAAAEGMIMAYAAHRQKRKTFIVDTGPDTEEGGGVLPQTRAVVQGRAEGFGLNVVLGDAKKLLAEEKIAKDVFGVLIQYPGSDGHIASKEEIDHLTDLTHETGAHLLVASDLLALTLMRPPSLFGTKGKGADIVFGNAGRFGVPLGYGGPHAAFFACTESHMRRMPGRLVGVSIDAQGNRGLRLALQTREQHIRREKATSNICTAQALLANISAMYAVYHGPEGLKRIARKCAATAALFAEAARRGGHSIVSESFFDTITLEPRNGADDFIAKAVDKGYHLRHVNAKRVGITVDETITREDAQAIVDLLTGSTTEDVTTLAASLPSFKSHFAEPDSQPSHIPKSSLRPSSAPVLPHSIFNCHHSETGLMRYMTYLQHKDITLAKSMIPLGSCTMKLNSATSLRGLEMPEWTNVHPLVPLNHARGYTALIDELEKDLELITGFDAVSLQPNSGAQGEYAGLRVIKAYHEAQGHPHRNVALIPLSAHGTNPASAVMAGMRVVPIKALPNGNTDLDDLRAKAEEHKDNLAAFMVTYPSTFGVYEEGIKDACDIVHANGGQVYMDGANMNAQVGLCTPGGIGADVCHLNLHKTFGIPHGGGGPGVGPIGVKSHLAPFLPGHPLIEVGSKEAILPIAAAPFGSASILTISWAYIKMLGGRGLTDSTKYAMLAANYMAARLSAHYKVLYRNEKTGLCAHEFILDLRPFKDSAGIEAIDVAKRLQDYNFHSPTLAWPVSGTIMVEPTESEDLGELDRFCEAMTQIRAEIAEIEAGRFNQTNNLLKNSPHTTEMISQRHGWDGPENGGKSEQEDDRKVRPYSRERAVYPVRYLKEKKHWPAIARVSDTYGDRNLVCSCDIDDQFLAESNSDPQRESAPTNIGAQ